MAEPFIETLHVGITLSASGQSAHADGGNVKELALRVRLHGFTGTLRIWVDVAAGDDFFALVCGPTLLTLEIELGKALYKVSPAPDALKLSGLVVARALREITSDDVTGNPILYREYTFEFQDAARALWSQHHPCAVYAKSTLGKVIAENTPEALALRATWPALSAVRPMLCLGLGVEPASFYDFVFWIAHAEGGHIWYDYQKQNLVIDSAKPSVGARQDLAFGSIESSSRFQVTFAPPPRAAVKVLNSRDGATPELSVDQPNAATGVRHDFMLHSALNADGEALGKALKGRFATGRFDVHVDCDAYPEMYLAPGSSIALASEFGSQFFVSDQSLRVIGLDIVAVATNQTPEYDIENITTDYQVTFALDLEAADDPRWRGHDYRTPRYPLRVEGKVLSAIGNTGERPYSIYAEADATSTYKVQLALWNATITIPVTPDFLPGHLYFPVYKDSRVFVSCELDSARIERFLDWGKDVPVPSASQGNHLLLGKSDTSETSIKHWYVDNSPQLVIGRVNAGDMATVTVKEGTLTLELTDESSSSGFGATVSVEPQAQMAKADSSQKADLAVADLQGGAQTATTQLSGSVDDASNALRQQSQQLSSQIKAKSRSIDQALADVGAGIDAQAQAAESLISDARAQIEELLK
ncbi:MAG TPA: hypothetical protein VMG12_03840 [Polyangiaceae bacterium]|nr:hypothetical protein [Polyangiaceae bacterium]